LQTSMELQVQNQPYVCQPSHHIWMPLCVSFEAPYEEQPSTMELQAHSKKNLLTLWKEHKWFIEFM
jgi:hypothetical protein